MRFSPKPQPQGHQVLWPSSHSRGPLGKVSVGDRKEARARAGHKAMCEWLCRWPGEQESGLWGKGRGSLLHCREKAKLGGSDVFRVLE